MAQADEEVKKLEATVIAKRREGEAFRLRNNIVSVERDESESRPAEELRRGERNRSPATVEDRSAVDAQRLCAP